MSNWLELRTYVGKMPSQLFVGTESEVDYCNNVKAGVMRCKIRHLIGTWLGFKSASALAKALFYFTREDL